MTKLKTNHYGHTGYISNVAISPDGSLCASGGKDGITMVKYLWNQLIYASCGIWTMASIYTRWKLVMLPTLFASLPTDTGSVLPLPLVSKSGISNPNPSWTSSVPSSLNKPREVLYPNAFPLHGQPMDKLCSLDILIMWFVCGKSPARPSKSRNYFE